MSEREIQEFFVSFLAVDWDVALDQLRSHNLQALFTQSLGWNSVQIGENTASLQPLRYLKVTCTPIAQRREIVVWQVRLTPKTQFDTDFRHQVHSAITEQMCSSQQESEQSPVALSARPLVVFVDTVKKRSLWCQSENESALYIAGQPATLWRFRLQRFAKASGSSACKALFPFLSQAGRATFQQLVEEIAEGTTGIDEIADRKAYAALTVQRLIFIQQLQQQGFMNGDTWYLQTYFGQAMQQGENLFYATYLRSLYQHLSLPALERPTALQGIIGKVPFLGTLFDTHWIEAKYNAIAITDQAFENLLGWLSEQGTTGALNPWLSAELSYEISQYWQQEKRGKTDSSTPELARQMCAQSLDALLLDRLNIKSASDNQTLNDLLFEADTQICRRLIQEILPNLKILDPACASGPLLVTFYQRLIEIFSVLTGHIQQSKDAQLKLWHSALTERSQQDSSVLIQNIQKRVLQNNLYGVAASTQEMEAAHFQLLLHLVATAQRPEQVESLIDLSFNVMHGSALIGFINVDEERFDQINKAGSGTVLQGNLLQPLAADGYQTILSERNIALEHYQTRTQVLASSHNIPTYAMADLLRSQISDLDTKAQAKLDALLLNQMSQQMGIRYRQSSLIEKPRHRLLDLKDIEKLTPFHWGYRFSEIIRRGGFDIVACLPPSGVFKPTVTEFLQQFQGLRQEKSLTLKTFKTSRAALTKADSEVVERWLRYQDQYGCASDYFYRSELYRHQTSDSEGKRVRSQLAWERLFVEQCFNLLLPRGIGAVAISTDTLADNRIQPLLQFIASESQHSEIAESSSELESFEHAVLIIKR